MANTPLDNEAIKALLRAPVRSSAKNITPYPLHPQNGPLRHVEQQGHCASRRCTTATYFKVNGISYCTSHAMIEMNKLCVKAGVSASQCPGCGIYWSSSYVELNVYDDITFDKTRMAYVCRACDEVIAQGPREL